MKDQTDAPGTAGITDITPAEAAASVGGGICGLKTGALAGLALFGPLGIIPGALIGGGAGSQAGRALLRWLQGT